MWRPPYRLGYPVTKIRLYSSVIASIFFSFLLYSASANLKWFTIAREIYLAVGFVEGLLIGYLEAEVVTKELRKKTETVVWQFLPIGVILFGLSLFLAINLFGTSEFLPFAAYFVFPFVPAYYATSGWRYNKFEKENKVQIFMFVYGFKYWIEPIVDVSHEFARFMKAVASKDFSTIFYLARHSEKFMTKLEEKEEIEPSTRNPLSKILETAKKYHQRSLAWASIFVVSCLFLIVYFFVLASTNGFGLIEVADGRIVSGQAIALIMLCVPTFSILGSVVAGRLLLNRKYKNRISALLAHSDLEMLSKLKNRDEP